MASCDFSGTATPTVTRCESDAEDVVQYLTGAGTSTLTVTDADAKFIEMSTSDPSVGATTQFLNIVGNSTIYNNGYSGVYSQTNAANHDLTAQIGSGVNITATGGGFGGIWFRNDTSGDLSLTSGATVHTDTGAAITLVTNGGAVHLVNNGSVTTTSSNSNNDAGLYGENGSSTPGAGSVYIENNGTVDAFRPGIRGINYNDTLEIVNNGTILSHAMQGIIGWSDTSDVTIRNTGSVTSNDSIGLQGWAGGDVSIVNSGTVEAGSDPTLSLSSYAGIGVQAWSLTEGDVQVINATGGSIHSQEAMGIDTMTTDGDIEILNQGDVQGASGIGANATGGDVEIVNEGSVTATTGTGVNAVASSGSVSFGNSGDISGASGVVLAASGSALVANTGTIAATTGTAVSIQAVSGDISFENSGEIRGASGVHLDSSGNVSATNTGTITATTGTAVDAAHVAGDIAFGNSGDIVGASGISLDGNGSASVTNVGSITATSGVGAYIAGNGGDAILKNAGEISGLDGVLLSGIDSASVANSGTISATSGTGFTAAASDGDLTFGNSGTISGASGVVLGAHDSVVASNFGTISATTGAAFEATVISNGVSLDNHGTISGASGVVLGGSHDPVTLLNAGTISATSGIGADISGLGGSTIVNSGDISGSTGLSVSDAASTITNTGTIDGTTYGIVFNSSGNVLSSSGHISGGTAAILYNQGGNTLNISQSTTFGGLVDFNNTTGNTTTFGGGSYHIAASEYLDAENAITLHDGSQTVVLNHPDTTGSINVVELPSASQIGNQYTASTSLVIGSILSLDVARPTVTPSASTNALAYGETGKQTAAANAVASLGDGLAVDAAGNLFWIRAFGGGRDQSASNTDPANDSSYIGLISGVDHQFDGYRLGLFGGAGHITSNVKGGASSISGDTGFVGSYGSTRIDGFDLNAALTLGAIWNTSDRSINAGTEVATGDFTGIYLSPEVAISRAIALNDTWTLTPSLKGRYTGAFYDGYSETGSMQNLTYDARQSHALEGRAQVDLAYTLMTEEGLRTQLTLTGAVSDTQYVGNSVLKASLDGSDFSITDRSDKNVLSATLGVGFDSQLTSNIGVYGSVEGTLGSDKSRSYVGRLGLKVAF